MSWYELLTVISGAWGGGALGAWYLSKTLIEHKLTAEREAAAIVLRNQLDSNRLTLEAEIRKQVEFAIGEAASDRQYRLEARKRLYTAVGPLRFQLLLACRDLSNRVAGHGRKDYPFNIENYYARSFIYRVIRPLAIFELIERQMSEADFSVDPIGRKLLQYHSAAGEILCGSYLVDPHSKKDMSRQAEHVFHSNLSVLSAALIKKEDGRERCMRYEEFIEYSFSQDDAATLEPLRTIFTFFSEQTRPLFWLRLVAYGHLCDLLINALGEGIGFKPRALDIEERLRRTLDVEITRDIENYVERCNIVAAAQL